MIKILYNGIAVPLVYAGFRAFALANDKAKQGIQGRKNLFKKLEAGVQTFPEGKPRVLMHVSSVGEYLQVVPVIKALKEREDIAVILSFTSPSLTSQLAKTPAADLNTFLPFDFKGQVERFLDLVSPSLLVFSAYDVWPNLLWSASDRSIPAVLINATLSETSARLWPVARSFFSRLFSELKAVAAISEEDAARFRGMGLAYVEVAGNCRYDQTLVRCQSVGKDDPPLNSLPDWSLTLIAGSVWPEDLKELLPAFYELKKRHGGLGLIIAPHEPTQAHLEQIEKDLAGAGLSHVRLSSSAKDKPVDAVIVDSVGVLFKLYRGGDLAFVGGSFKSSVHNVMEPAGMGLPVVVGPCYRNSQEAILMLERGGLKSAGDKHELQSILGKWIDDEEERGQAGKRAYKVVMENSGATERTVELLERFTMK